MEQAKVFFTDFRCHPGVNQQQKLEKLLSSDHYHLYEVEVWETRTSGCVYRGE